MIDIGASHNLVKQIPELTQTGGSTVCLARLAVETWRQPSAWRECSAHAHQPWGLSRSAPTGTKPPFLGAERRYALLNTVGDLHAAPAGASELWLGPAPAKTFRAFY